MRPSGSGLRCPIWNRSRTDGAPVRVSRSSWHYVPRSVFIRRPCWKHGSGGSMPKRPQLPSDLSPTGPNILKNRSESRVVLNTTNNDGEGFPPNRSVAVVTANPVEVQTPASSQLSEKRARNTALLIREACRAEVLRFMPAVSKILHDPKTNNGTRLRLFETLLQYGVGQKMPESKTPANVNIQTAVIALQPRIQASSILPIANPSPSEKIATSGLAPLGNGISGG